MISSGRASSLAGKETDTQHESKTGHKRFHTAAALLTQKLLHRRDSRPAVRRLEGKRHIAQGAQFLPARICRSGHPLEEFDRQAYIFEGHGPAIEFPQQARAIHTQERQFQCGNIRSFEPDEGFMNITLSTGHSRKQTQGPQLRHGAFYKGKEKRACRLHITCLPLQVCFIYLSLDPLAPTRNGTTVLRCAGAGKQQKQETSQGNAAPCQP